mmetsp:Transcript_26467/g.57744  ORF Transcript_26467/g.57744 Transcript_26467/m.57744 type:complete len:307 (-) Transcript_26467:2067-2987(-)
MSRFHLGPVRSACKAQRHNRNKHIFIAEGYLQQQVQQVEGDCNSHVVVPELYRSLDVLAVLLGRRADAQACAMRKSASISSFDEDDVDEFEEWTVEEESSLVYLLKTSTTSKPNWTQLSRNLSLSAHTPADIQRHWTNTRLEAKHQATTLYQQSIKQGFGLDPTNPALSQGKGPLFAHLLHQHLHHLQQLQEELRQQQQQQKPSLQPCYRRSSHTVGLSSRRPLCMTSRATTFTLKRRAADLSVDAEICSGDEGARSDGSQSDMEAVSEDSLSDMVSEPGSPRSCPTSPRTPELLQPSLKRTCLWR